MASNVLKTVSNFASSPVGRGTGKIIYICACLGAASGFCNGIQMYLEQKSKKSSKTIGCAYVDPAYNAFTDAPYFITIVGKSVVCNTLFGAVAPIVYFPLRYWKAKDKDQLPNNL